MLLKELEKQVSYLALGSCLLIPQEVLQCLKALLPPKAKGYLKGYPEQKVMGFVALLLCCPLSTVWTITGNSWDFYIHGAPKSFSALCSKVV